MSRQGNKGAYISTVKERVVDTSGLTVDTRTEKTKKTKKAKPEIIRPARRPQGIAAVMQVAFKCRGSDAETIYAIFGDIQDLMGDTFIDMSKRATVVDLIDLIVQYENNVDSLVNDAYELYAPGDGKMIKKMHSEMLSYPLSEEGNLRKITESLLDKKMEWKRRRDELLHVNYEADYLIAVESIPYSEEGLSRDDVRLIVRESIYNSKGDYGFLKLLQDHPNGWKTYILEYTILGRFTNKQVLRDDELIESLVNFYTHSILFYASLHKDVDGYKYWLSENIPSYYLIVDNYDYEVERLMEKYYNRDNGSSLLWDNRKMKVYDDAHVKSVSDELVETRGSIIPNQGRCKCGHNRYVSRSIQLAKGDEAAHVYNTCARTSCAAAINL